MNGFEAARRIKHELPSTLILMVSQFDSAPFAREAVAAGASGYVVKSNAAADLIPALRNIHSQRVRTAAEFRTPTPVEILRRIPDSRRTGLAEDSQRIGLTEDACSDDPRLTPQPNSEPEN
jgi:DNA-binding NarL/FixJ family response regulator